MEFSGDRMSMKTNSLLAESNWFLMAFLQILTHLNMWASKNILNDMQQPSSLEWLINLKKKCINGMHKFS